MSTMINIADHYCSGLTRIRSLIDDHDRCQNLLMSS